MKTYIPKPSEMSQTWWILDAENKILGRLATRVASVLRGKHRPDFTPHLDLGDHVIVVNAEKVAVTGNKLDQKLYRRHSGFKGSLKETTLRTVLARKPEMAITEAVRRMLPKSRLGRQMLTKLRVYAGPEHPHVAQKPQPLVAGSED